MEQDSFVKIENRELPVDKFKNFDFDDINRNNRGFTNIIFLTGIIFTFFMWLLLIFVWR